MLSSLQTQTGVSWCLAPGFKMTFATGEKKGDRKLTTKILPKRMRFCCSSLQQGLIVWVIPVRARERERTKTIKPDTTLVELSDEMELTHNKDKKVHLSKEHEVNQKDK